MRNIYFIFFMMYPYLTAGISAQSPEKQLPKQFHSYTLSESYTSTPDELFDFINGGAELYLSYGFVGMTGCRYEADDNTEITIEIYEMTNAKNAFGVYTQTRDKEESDFGQGSQSYKDAIIFWKDRYFVLINTTKSTLQSQEAIQYLASVTDKSIDNKGSIPDIIGYLPQKDLIQGGVLYFHHYIWLNAYYFIADYNILNIDENADAVLARYGSSQQRSYLLLVEYSDAVATEKAYNQLKQKYAPEIKSDEIIQIEDGSWFTVWLNDNKLGAIFNGTSKEIIEELRNNTINKM